MMALSAKNTVFQQIAVSSWNPFGSIRDVVYWCAIGVAVIGGGLLFLRYAMHLDKDALWGAAIGAVIGGAAMQRYCIRITATASSDRMQMLIGALELVGYEQRATHGNTRDYYPKLPRSLVWDSNWCALTANGSSVILEGPYIAFKRIRKYTAP